MIDYKIIRSRRRTVSLSVSKTLEIIVRAPMRMSARDIDSFVAAHEDWVARQIPIMQERSRRETAAKLDDEQIAELRRLAKEKLPVKVQHFAEQMGVKPTGITITSATTRWGSCSPRDRLSFPYRLMLLPDELVDYIVVHELAHIREKNHSARFYAVVEEQMPDHKERRAALKKQ